MSQLQPRLRAETQLILRQIAHDDGQPTLLDPPLVPCATRLSALAQPREPRLSILRANVCDDMGDLVGARHQKVAQQESAEEARDAGEEHGGFVVGGALFTEIVFSYPGIGYALLQGIQNADYPLVQGIFLVIALAVLCANFLADIFNVVLDPRVR